MDTGTNGQISYLDSVMLREGVDKCGSALTEVYKRNGPGAVALINDRRLTFSCFYVLLPRIRELNLGGYLNSRNIIAFRIISQILDRRISGGDYLSVKKNRIYTVLKWIFETGSGMDGYDDDYEEILDVTASVLLNTYKDRSILPAAVDMIFTRKKYGRYIHDLVWALFRTEDPQVLRLIADRLRSSDEEEYDLACELLNIGETCGEILNIRDRETRHAAYIKWLEENDPFLYFTENGYQFESNPVFSAVDVERRYLNKNMNEYKKQPVLPSDELESRCLQAFRALSDQDKELLSRYSRIVHERDEAEWESFVRFPVYEQLNIAKKEGGLLQ